MGAKGVKPTWIGRQRAAHFSSRRRRPRFCARPRHWEASGEDPSGGAGCLHLGAANRAGIRPRRLPVHLVNRQVGLVPTARGGKAILGAAHRARANRAIATITAFLFAHPEPHRQYLLICRRILPERRISFYFYRSARAPSRPVPLPSSIRPGPPRAACL